MKKHFGTDGIRGVANEKLTPELAMSLGRAAGLWLVNKGHTKKVVVGMDTRRSGIMLRDALSAGFNSAGVDVLLMGVAPTPAVSFAVRAGDFGLGIVISASHNPAPDNGIKVFGPNGRKLADEDEVEIEVFMETGGARPTGAQIGITSPAPELVDDYVSMLSTIVPKGLAGLKIAVDGANGAAFEIAPRVLRELGAEVVCKGINPDGININAEGGATKPETIQSFTLDSGCDVGASFDGDADRVVFSDEQGRLINGDRTIGIWALHKKEKGELEPPVVVGTVMSNGAFEHFMNLKGIALERTPVGDKYVSQKIEQSNAKIGGEQSGHIIFPAHGPSGDGLVTMLELLGVLKESGRKMSDYYDDYQPWPQVLVNMEVNDCSTWNDGEQVQTALEQAHRMLSGHGRINVRASGTQPIVRIMVEAEDLDLRDIVAASIVGAITQEAGGKVYSRVDLTYALGD